MHKTAFSSNGSQSICTKCAHSKDAKSVGMDKYRGFRGVGNGWYILFLLKLSITLLNAHPSGD
jgi:hypothetical protein